VKETRGGRGIKEGGEKDVRGNNNTGQKESAERGGERGKGEEGGGKRKR